MQEVDIIAQKEDVLCIVEVKWRKSNFHGAPYEFVTPKKRKLLARARATLIIIGLHDFGKVGCLRS